MDWIQIEIHFGFFTIFKNFFFSYIVGKTSLITRFMYDTFDGTYQVNLSFHFWDYQRSLFQGRSRHGLIRAFYGSFKTDGSHSYVTGNDRNRLSLKDHVPGRQNRQTAGESRYPFLFGINLVRTESRL